MLHSIYFLENFLTSCVTVPQNIMDMCNVKYEEIMKDKSEEDGKKKKSQRHPFSDKMHKVGDFENYKSM